jgi:hypothetical protein
LIQIIYELVGVDDEGLVKGFYFEFIDTLAENCIDPSKID